MKTTVNKKLKTRVKVSPKALVRVRSQIELINLRHRRKLAKSSKA